jgi:predicted ATPase/class 3 adenylate cyclase
MPAELPAGTVTLLFTDIEGSTRMLQELGREQYVRALTEHRRLLREAFIGNGGVEVEMQGDSFHFAFPYARDAVAGALAGQEALAKHSWESQPIKVRIGLHTGEPMQAEGLYAGLDVHHAARVMGAAHGGQTLLSARTAELVEGELPRGVRLLDLGQHRLKDLTAAQHLYQAGEGTYPPLKTLPSQSNLPVAASPLVGRERELAELATLLTDGARIVTITGTGGAGKTRLSLQVAADVLESFPDGVVWIPLAALADASLVLPAISQALGFTGSLEQGLAQRRVLLVLDNLEHLLDAAADLSRLLSTAPHAKVLATSRAPLQIEGEHEYALASLDDQSAAVLFRARSSAAGRQVEDGAPVAQICQRLDNLPLAIELAAARSKLLDPDTLLRRLENRLGLLTGGRRDAPERQRTLRATIDWSYGLLEERGRELFTRLAVFPGNFSLEAAEAICDADLDTLQALVDLNLLKAVGHDRFLMLETIREYGRERLATSDQANDVRRRYANWFAVIAYTQARAARDFDPTAVEILTRDEHNFRAALSTSIELRLNEDGVRLLVGLWFYLATRGYAEELERFARLVLALPPVDDPALRGEALAVGGEALRLRGDFAGARAWKEAALPLQREVGDQRLVASTLTDLASVLANQGDFKDAERFAREGLAIREALGDERGVAHARAGLAEVAFFQGDYESALELYSADSEAYRANPGDAGWWAGTTGGVLRRMGRLGDASDRLAEAVRLATSVDDVSVLVDALRELAAVAHALGDARSAAVILGGAERIFSESGLQVWDERDFEELVTSIRQSLSDEELKSEWARGGKLKRADLTRFALAAVHESPGLAWQGTD